MSLLRLKLVIKFNNYHSNSTSKHVLKKVKFKNSQMEPITKFDVKEKHRLKKGKLKNHQTEFLTKFDVKENTDNVPSSGSSHKRITTKDYRKMDKYKDSHMKSPIRSYMKKDTYNVPGSISNTKGLLRHKPVIQFDNSHKTSTSQDQLKVVE